MPRASTLILILAAVFLYALGYSAAVPAAVVLAMALEFAVWKRAVDGQRALRAARIAAGPLRHRR
jgi:hypothetical protein